MAKRRKMIVMQWKYKWRKYQSAKKCWLKAAGASAKMAMAKYLMWWPQPWNGINEAINVIMAAKIISARRRGRMEIIKRYIMANSMAAKMRMQSNGGSGGVYPAAKWKSKMRLASGKLNLYGGENNGVMAIMSAGERAISYLWRNALISSNGNAVKWRLLGSGEKWRS